MTQDCFHGPENYLPTKVGHTPKFLHLLFPSRQTSHATGGSHTNGPSSPLSIHKRESRNVAQLERVHGRKLIKQHESILSRSLNSPCLASCFQACRSRNSKLSFKEEIHDSRLCNVELVPRFDCCVVSLRQAQTPNNGHVIIRHCFDPWIYVTVWCHSGNVVVEWTTDCIVVGRCFGIHKLEFSLRMSGQLLITLHHGSE